MYYLPLEIKGRGFHIAALRKAGHDNPSPIKQYVLENRGVSTRLFNFDSDTRLIADGGFSKDLDWMHLTIDFDASLQRLIINIKTIGVKTAKPDRKKPYTVSEGLPILCDEAGGHVEIMAAATLIGTFEVLIQADIQGLATHSTRFILHIAPMTQIWDIALDFGSEASQLSKRAANSGNPQMVPMINSLKSFYTDFIPIRKDEFLQHDKDGFFRSIFFAAAEAENRLEITDKPNTTHEIVPMLNAWKQYDQFKTHTMLPTVKLVTLGIKNAKTLKVNGFARSLGDVAQQLHRKLIFNFLHAACASIQHANPLYLRFKLLIPNVFNQSDITLLVQEMERESALFITKFEKEYQIKGIEVSTISESDAAFAGYMLNPNLELRQNGKYAIIDVGRGTTDYSVVEIIRPTEAVGLYRSGFIGAGAMLTFSFIDTVITTILVDHLQKSLTNQQRQTFFQDKICSNKADLSWKLNFLALIEKIKARHEKVMENPESDELITRRKDILNTNLDTLSTALLDFVDAKTDFYIKDRFGFIKNTTDELANRIFDHFKKLPKEFATLDGIILSGRGALFSPLEKALREKFKSTQIVLSEQPKNICIDGAFTANRFNGNCNMEGIPYAVRFLGDQTQELSTNIQMDAPILSGFDTFIRNAKQWFTEEEKNVAPTKYYQDIQKFLKGHARQQMKANERICISGNVYSHSNDFKIDKENINLFFTGEYFLIRNKDKAEILRADTRSLNITDPFIAKTLFPTMHGTDLPLGVIP